MIKYIETEEDLSQANRIGRHRVKNGLTVDPMKYSGAKGKYTMIFDGKEYVPEFSNKDCSLLMGFDSYALEKLLLRL